MDKLWSPWRSNYIQSFKDKDESAKCVFCNVESALSDQRAHQSADVQDQRGPARLVAELASEDFAPVPLLAATALHGLLHVSRTDNTIHDRNFEGRRIFRTLLSMETKRKV